MTRANSVEIGGRASRTTSSMACRNEEPARRAFAIRVIVSGSCLLNWLIRLPWRRWTYQRGQEEADDRADEEEDRVLERREDEAGEEHEDRDADDRADPDEEVLADLQLEVGPGQLARQVGPEVALLDDLVELRDRGALRDEVAERGASSRRPSWPRPCRRRSARGARSRRSRRRYEAIPTAMRRMASAATAATTMVSGTACPPAR